VVIVTGSGPLLVGPDNGVLSLAADALGGATQAFAITNEALFLETPSRTFHGRDIFAPVAARLALGMPLEDVGPSVPVKDLIRIDMPAARVDDDHIHSRVAQIDHFGNLALNFGRSELEGIGVLLGDAIEVRVGGRSFKAPYSQAFSEVKKGGLILLEDSHRHLMLAINMGNARETLEARRGDPVIIARVQIGGN
jgi:S-adenosylmethionine hydrolase